ncbi:premnaspirodiene oxygenase-like [Aristolochia californica]|uniref:premnaspirodiene oxygenase-like n=1 Tax=Aristolochia californica TaxID=171875 RepID=UPI0035DAFDAD
MEQLGKDVKDLSGELRARLSLCEQALANGGDVHAQAKIKVPEPKSFNGKRDAKNTLKKGTRAHDRGAPGVMRTTLNNLNLPPGPWKLPMIGSVHHLAGGSLPHRILRDLAKKHGPLMHLKMGEVPLVVASTAEAAKEIMKTHDRSFASRPELPAARHNTYGFTDVAFAPYGAYWRQMRKICVLELLTIKRVESFGFIRDEEVLNMLSSISVSCNSLVNLTRKFYYLTNNVVARAAFGHRSQYVDKFLFVIGDAIKEAGGFSVADLFPSSKLLFWITGMKAKMEKNHHMLDEILSKVLEECKVRYKIKNRDGDDSDENLVDILLRLQQRGNFEVPITDDNIKAVILDVFTAGTETSTNVLGWTMTELMRNPRVMIKAQEEVRELLRGKEKVTEADIQDLKYLKLVVKETLRLHPPLPLLLPRESREKCTVMGYEIPAQTRAISNVWAIGRDPLTWGDDAESFRPERFDDSLIDFKGANFEFLPFGAGRRMCPGIAFGIADVEHPLALLLCHFNWELPEAMKPEDIDMTEVFGAAVARKSDLCLVPKLCYPLPDL